MKRTGFMQNDHVGFCTSKLQFIFRLCKYCGRFFEDEFSSVCYREAAVSGTRPNIRNVRR